MTFIEQMQEEAKEKLARTSEYINDTLWYVNPQDLDSIISQVVQNTVEEIEKKVEQLKKLPDKNFGEGELRHNYERNQTVAQVQSLLKEITSDKTEPILTDEEGIREILKEANAEQRKIMGLDK